MNRAQTIKHLVSQFEEQLEKLSENKLKDLEAGKLEINFTQSVGKEAGGFGGQRRLTPIPARAAPRRKP